MTSPVRIASVSGSRWIVHAWRPRKGICRKLKNKEHGVVRPLLSFQVRCPDGDRQRLARFSIDHSPLSSRSRGMIPGPSRGANERDAEAKGHFSRDGGPVEDGAHLPCGAVARAHTDSSSPADQPRIHRKALDRIGGEIQGIQEGDDDQIMQSFPGNIDMHGQLHISSRQQGNQMKHPIFPIELKGQDGGYQHGDGLPRMEDQIRGEGLTRG